MEQIITKPLKRFISNSKEYAKKHFSDIYNSHAVEYSTNKGEDAIIMTEIKSIMRTPPNSRDTHKQIIKHNVLFDENLRISSPGTPRKCTLNNCVININEENKNSANINNNTIEHLTVKLIESPTKEIVTVFNLPQTESDKSLPENSESKQPEDIKKSTQHIKVKIIVPRNTTNTDSNKLEDFISTNVLKDKESSENACIFEENKYCPLSPVLPKCKVVHQFPVVDELIDFHERQMFQLTGGCAPEKPPLMGTSALWSRALNSQSTLDDSEIVSALVRNRFVVNMYESRTCRRNRNKPSRFGRIYKSLERTVGTDFSSNMVTDKVTMLNKTVPELINVNESSPIRLTDQFVSLNLNSNSENNCISNQECQNTIKHEMTVQTSIQENVNEDAKTNDMTSLDSENEYSHQNNQDVKNEENIEAENVKESDNEEIVDAKSTYTENSDEMMSSGDISSVFNEDFGNSTTSSNTITENCQHINDQEDTIHETQIVETKESKNDILENTQGTDASYDMEEFLQKALGDELCNDTSSFDATTESKGKVKAPAERYILAEDSICTSDASDLISKINTFQSNFYRSLTRKLQHMSNTFRAPPSSKREVSADDELNSIFPNNEQVTELVQQAAVQYEAMKQISKALTVCRTTKEFTGSMEQIEGERLLLVAANKRQAILDEIRRLDYAVEETNFCSETGTVTISDVTFPLKSEITEQQTTKRDQKQWYVCIFACGPKVFATQPTLAKMDGSIRFSEEITFADLPSDFTISVEIYSLLQRRGSRNFSHESKFHINKCSKRSHCPTPKKFLHREKLAQKIPARYDIGIRTSSFKICGGLNLRVSDLAKSNPWMLRNVPMCSPLDGSVTLTLQSRVQIPIRHSGFMTIGIEIGGCIAWNRRWCVVDGHMLRSWNYPCDEDAFIPLHEIHLKKCVNARVDLVDRSLCAKSRTLLLETTTKPEYTKKTLNETHTIKRYLLSADNAADLQLWKEHLNTVISALRTWNAGYEF